MSRTRAAPEVNVSRTCRSTTGFQRIVDACCLTRLADSIWSALKVWCCVASTSTPSALKTIEAAIALGSDDAAPASAQSIHDTAAIAELVRPLLETKASTREPAIQQNALKVWSGLVTQFSNAKGEQTALREECAPACIQGWPYHTPAGWYSQPRTQPTTVANTSWCWF